MMKRSFLNKSICMLALVMFCAVSLTGCASLRKKFTRAPKNPQVKQDFIPILQPVEYENIEQTPQQVYAGHYSMVKIYFKDLTDILGRRDSSVKREKYMFNELMRHFDAMAAFLSDAKKTEAAAIRARVDDLLREYGKPDAMRRYDLMSGQVRLIERDVYKNFKPAAVADAFAAAVPAVAP
jgi:hypothetical protein